LRFLKITPFPKATELEAHHFKLRAVCFIRLALIFYEPEFMDLEISNRCNFQISKRLPGWKLAP
jgi:hypothetical protein